MSKGRLWLGLPGSEVLLPSMNRKFSEEDIEDIREAKTAGGTYVADIVAVKKRFVIAYGTIKNSDLEIIKNIYQQGHVLSFKVEQSDASIKTYSVKRRPFARQRLEMASRWYWDGISLTLDEI